MTNSKNKQAVAVKTRVSAGALVSNHSETVAVKTRVSAGALDAAIKAIGAIQSTNNHNETVAVKRA